MQYEVVIIDVKDADAIVINYHDGARWWTAVVDAGNVGDANSVKKHPNPAVVHYLSKHCNVYSTSKCNGALIYQSAPVNTPAEALRKKQK
jgi:hypothetical protein